MTLYELNQAFNNLMEVMDNTEEQDIKDLIKDSLNQIQLDTEKKIENIIRYIKNLEYESKALEEESKRLKEKQKTTDNKIDNLKGYLKDFTSTVDGKKYKADIFNLSIRKNAPSVNVVNLEDIPSQFIETETVIKVNKNEIKRAVKGGEIIPGIEMVQSESLIIK